MIFTVALASNFNAGQANAIDCKTISVPWRWQLNYSGTSNISVDADNRTGSSFTTSRDQEDIDGAFIVKLLFDEPSNYCEKLGNAPTATTLKIVGSFTGLLGSSFFRIITVPPVPELEGPFAGASASVNILPAFEPKKLYSGFSQEIYEKTETVRTVGDGSSISFTGNLDAFAYKGLIDGSGGFSVAVARLDVTGAFTGETSGTVDYTVPVPEPLTIVGSATGLGFAAFFKRKHSKKQKKS